MAEQGASALAGKKIVVTRAAEQSRALMEELEMRGADAILLPLIAVAAADDYGALDAALSPLGNFDWLLFTSENAVAAVARRLKLLNKDGREFAKTRHVAAVGPATAEAARRAGFSIDHLATTHNGVALAEELGERVRDKSVFLPRSDRANSDLPEALKHFGARVTEVIAYKTLPPGDMDKNKVEAIRRGEVDAVLFFSPTAVRHLVEVIGVPKLGELQGRVALTAIGPVTARELSHAQIDQILVASDATPVAVIAVLEEYFSDAAARSSRGVHSA